MIMKKIAIGALLIAACATFFWNCSSETNSVSSCVGSACVEFPEIADFTVTDSCYWLQGESNILIYKDGRVTDQNGNDIGTFDLAEGTIVMDNGSTISDISLNDLTLLTPEMVQQAKEAAKEEPQDEPEENPTENTSSNSHEQPSPDGNSSNSNNGENSNQGNNDGNNSSSSNGSSPVPSSSSKEEEVVDASGYPIASYGKLTENDQGVTKGFATRYWDACKPHCSWPEKVNPNANPYRIARNCNINGEEIPAFTKSEDGTWLKGTVSACDNGGFAYTCIDMIPVAVNDTLAYAFGAAPGVDEKTTCGKCYQIQFTGEGKYGTKEAHGLIARKTLIIMSSNVGHDVTGGQFDIMIPGGGVGAYDALSTQLGVNKSDLGEQMGGFYTTCENRLGADAPVTKFKECVTQQCESVFGSRNTTLYKGCMWFVNWFETANNPVTLFKQVECPQYLVDKFTSTLNTSPNLADAPNYQNF